MPKPKAYIQRDIITLNGNVIDESDVTNDNVENVVYGLIPSEVEILFWGGTLFWHDNNTPLVITVAFCREKKTGLCLEVKPDQLSFDKEII